MIAFFVISSIALLILIGIILIVMITCGMYIIGLFNDRMAKRVELILFAVASLQPSQKNARKIPRHIRLFAKAIIYKRRLFVNKIKIRKLRQKRLLKNP